MCDDSHSIHRMCTAQDRSLTHHPKGVLLQVQHLAQMQTVYPEVMTLSYVNIPKSAVQTQTHCSGTQLLIELAASDSAAANGKESESSNDSPNVSRGSNHVAGQLGVGVPGASPGQAGVSGSPQGNVHMAAMKAEFERRLEKQVSSRCACSPVY